MTSMEAMKHTPTPPTRYPDSGCSAEWTKTVNRFRAPILHGIQALSRTAAVSPKRTIAAVVVASVALFVTGVLTNFSVDVNEDVLWTPMGSHPIRQMHWINDESGFPRPDRNLALLFHRDGRTDHVLGREAVLQIFEALDVIRHLDGYQRVCALWDETHECAIYGVTKFWNQSVDVLQAAAPTDQAVVEQMSALVFPDDSTPVSVHNILGNPVRNANGTLTSVQMYIVTISFPSLDDEDDTTVPDFEKQAIDAILDLQDEWARVAQDTPTQLQVEVFAERSFGDEFERAILKDIPLVPIVFVIMGLFTSAIFFKRDRIHSRSLFGFTAVVSILLSIMAGYGLLFICAIPFTSMTQILPFVFFGVGLDDAFIITGAYFRLDRRLDPVERVRITMDEIGISIFLTTLTSAVAMGLGCTSSIPAVYWLCLYAVPTTVLILLFQLTFFVACLVLDERRVEANHRDCCRCILVVRRTDASSHQDEEQVESTVDRWMGWYAEQLLRPSVKVLVLLSFTAITVACSISTSQLRQAFSFTDVLPGDSYITPFFRALVDYNERDAVTAVAYFRDVDQSSTMVQDEMEAYVNELVAIDAVTYQPQFFWLRDFRSFVSNHSDPTVATLDFNRQLDAFLADPVFYELYHNHIVRNATTGAIITSRCGINIDNIDQEEVKELVKTLNDQRAVSDAQPVNQGQSDYRFFTYDGNFNIWEFYARCAQEVVTNTVTSIAAMTGIALLLMPHWSAGFFVFPLISILYIDLLGVMQWAGVSINPVAYIGLVMSIGLLVDFILHTLLKFYEAPGNRHEKVVNLLKTMGSSILIGAITTFLGTLPLAFSTSDIFYTIFIAFLALVVLGATHGLILLPVILSMIGPEVEIPPVWTKPTVMTNPLPEGARPTGDRKRVDDDGLDDLESVHG